MPIEGIRGWRSIDSEFLGRVREKSRASGGADEL